MCLLTFKRQINSVLPVRMKSSNFNVKEHISGVVLSKGYLNGIIKGWLGT